MTQYDYDVVIIGGGMVGASLACALRHTSLRIALVDASPLKTDDTRLIALNYGSFCLFKHLGVWDAMSPYAEAIKQVHISDRGHFGATRLHAADMKLPTLGYVVPAKYINTALDTTLTNHLLDQNTSQRLAILRPATLKKLTQSEKCAHLTIETITNKTSTQEITLEARCVIGADGTHSTVRSELGINTHITDYQQSALVTITTLNRPHNNIAYERFHATGAIAMLPLTGQRAATIWTDQSTTIADLAQLDDSAFLTELQHQFGYRIGRLLGIDTRHVFPLKMLKSTATHKQHVLLVGNAAHTLHPIAAQGLNLALAEIAKLTEVIQNDATLVTWQPYLDWQKKQESISTRLSHQLPQLFTHDFLLLRLARQLAMVGLDIIPPLKRRLAWHSIGWAQNTPRLLLSSACKSG